MNTPHITRSEILPPLLTLPLFVILATANGAGYRYGASDQAFYVPVVVRALDPSAFPRDASLIDAQGRFMLADELLAAIARATGLPLPSLFLAGYLLSLVLVWAAIVAIGGRVYRSAWLTIALGAALTLRHHIPRTSANSLEPYFHPRMVAFGLGALAVAALLRGRRLAAVALVAAAALVHVTTGLWFAVLVGVALLLLHPPLRRPAVAAGALAAAAGAWAVAAGPLRASMTIMDEVWLQAVSSKDSLFPTGWPAWAWAANLALLAVLWWAFRIRVRRGEATAADAALVWGATALVALFLLTLPAVAARVALFVQLQISRVFWLVDFLATVYVIALFDGRRRAMAALAAILVAVSAARGAYIMLVERPERPLFAVTLPASAWDDAAAWIAAQPAGTHVLADPGHAWKYGTSLRVAAARDVFLEEVKDSAIAIYSREVAQRVVARTAALGEFQALTPERARALAARFDIDLLVTPADLPLPLAYRNDQFRVYRLAPSAAMHRRRRRRRSRGFHRGDAVTRGFTESRRRDF